MSQHEVTNAGTGRKRAGGEGRPGPERVVSTVDTTRESPVRKREAQAVRDGYRAVLAGVSLGEIAREVEPAGFVTGQKRWKGARHRGEPSRWQQDGVRAVLPQPALRRAARTGEDCRRCRLAAAHPMNRPTVPSRRADRFGAGASAAVGHHYSPGSRCARCWLLTVRLRRRVRQTRRVGRCTAARSTGDDAAPPSRVATVRRADHQAAISQPPTRELLTDHKRPDVSALREAIEPCGRGSTLWRSSSPTGRYVPDYAPRPRGFAGSWPPVGATMADAGRVDTLRPTSHLDDDTRAVLRGQSQRGASTPGDRRPGDRDDSSARPGTPPFR